MPINEYICLECGHQFEEIKPYNPDDKVQCNICEKFNTERLFPLPGGYYIRGNNGASSRPKSAGAFKKGSR